MNPKKIKELLLIIEELNYGRNIKKSSTLIEKFIKNNNISIADVAFLIRGGYIYYKANDNKDFVGYTCKITDVFTLIWFSSVVKKNKPFTNFDYALQIIGKSIAKNDFEFRWNNYMNITSNEIITEIEKEKLVNIVNGIISPV